MTLDGLTLHAVTDELNRRLENGKIQKVLMPGKEELALQIYSAAEGTMRLVVSADAGSCAVYLTEHTKPNPKEAPAFCMFLRKHLIGALVRKVEQKGLDRVVVLHLETRDELFRTIHLRLIVEIMGKYSNVILVNSEDRILDSIRRVPAERSSKRQILPGGKYEEPPQQKADPLTLDVETMARLLRPPHETRLDRFMTSVLGGISLQTSEEILARSGLETWNSVHLQETDYVRLAKTVSEFVGEAVSEPRPTIQTDSEGVPVFFSALPYATYPPQTRRDFSSANEMLDMYYTRRDEIARLRQSKDALLRSIRRELSKTERKVRIYEESVASASRVSQMQKRADLITANLYQLRKGMKSFNALDYETGEEVRVQLEPASTPTETAQKLYRKIAKLKRGASMNAAKLDEARDELDFLLGSQLFTEQASSIAELGQVRESLMEAGYIPRPRKSPRQSADSAQAEPLRFLAPGGYEVLVGRNDRQNELLTHHMASRDDIWFHAQKIPGSHVILRTHGTPLDQLADETVVFAAELAASHSRAKRSGKTPVDYTQRKNLKKPSHARPGKVIYETYYTVYVDANAPDQDKYRDPVGPPLGTM